MRIAVLIPVYNAEKFLRECLDSALAAGSEVEKAGHTFEIRCLDDGSRDGSVAILQEYANRFRCLTFSSQENSGVSLTRNRLMEGLSEDVDAFAFLDADDDVRPEIYVKLAEALERTGADVAETEWDGPETILDDMSVFILRRMSPGRWINVINKLYRRLAVGKIHFREGLCFEEDFFFNFEIHRTIHRKVLVPGRFYHYRKNPDSATSVLDQRKYFLSTTKRIRLSIDEYLNIGRIPPRMEIEYRKELSKDAYRMCIRKNLKKNRNAVLRHELFLLAGEFFRLLETEMGFRPIGLNPIQRTIYSFCVSRSYVLARFLIYLT